MKFGATNDFPRGKIHDSDEGGLQIGVTVKDKTVIIAFGTPVAWVGMPAEAALHLADTLRRRANEITPPEQAPRDPGARSLLAEAIHTAFRKGAEGEHAITIHAAIRDMPSEQWGNALAFILDCMDSMGWELRQKLEPPTYPNPDLTKMLRAIGESTDAKALKHDVIFNAAADELDHWRGQWSPPARKNKPLEMNVDPQRKINDPLTGIFVRAKFNGEYVNADIYELDRDSLLSWLRSRGGSNPWAESVVLGLLAHKQPE
jgi:hypothetical protein